MANKLWDERRIQLATQLKEGRITARMSQMMIAKKLGKPQSYVSKYESGERKLDFIEVLEVCAALQISPVDFVSAYINQIR